MHLASPLTSHDHDHDQRSGAPILASVREFSSSSGGIDWSFEEADSGGGNSPSFTQLYARFVLHSTDAARHLAFHKAAGILPRGVDFVE